MVRASLTKRHSQNNLKKNSNTTSNDVDVSENVSLKSKSVVNQKTKSGSSGDIDHDAFVKEYSITTNLYRYLAWRHKTRPIVLHRNLSFYKKKNRQKNVSCKTLSEIVDKLLPKAKPVAQSQQSDKVDDSSRFNFTFEGFFDSEVEKEWSTVEASLTAYVEHHWSHNRKKTSGRIIVPLTNSLALRCNPGDASRLDPLSLQSAQENEDDKESSCNSIFLHEDNLASIDIANKIHSSFLVFKINASERKIYSKVYDSPPNRRKSSKRPDAFPVNYQCVIPLHYSPHKHLPNLSAQMNLKSSITSYKVTPGTYEARLDVDVSPLSSLENLVPGKLKHQSASDSPDLEWLNVNFGSRSSAVSEYLRWPVIRFYVKGLPGKTTISAASSDLCVKTVESLVSPLEDRDPPVSEVLSPQPSTVSVTYRFMFHGEVGQWSEVNDLVCPWCRLDCGRAGPDALLSHLKASHPRFHFKSRLNRAANRLSIRVWVKRDIEGDLSDIGLMRSACQEEKSKPIKRAPSGNVICYKIPDKIPRQPDPDTYPPYASGHTRLYWHTWSSQPLRPKVFDYDSEEEDTLHWLHDHYKKNLHEFTDVNAGEKRIMQLWNSHLLKHNLVGDSQVEHAVTTFVVEHRVIILEEELRSNLLLHLSNLADFGLLRPDCFDKVMLELDSDPTTTATIR